MWKGFSLSGIDATSGFVRVSAVEYECSDSTVPFQVIVTPTNDWLGDTCCIANVNVPQLQTDAAQAIIEIPRSVLSAICEFTVP